MANANTCTCAITSTIPKSVCNKKNNDFDKEKKKAIPAEPIVCKQNPKQQ